MDARLPLEIHWDSNLRKREETVHVFLHKIQGSFLQSGWFRWQSVDLQSLLSVLKKDVSESGDQCSIEALEKSLTDTTGDEKNPTNPASVIEKKAYIDIMKAWAAFTATDINNEGNLDKNELKFLISSLLLPPTKYFSFNFGKDNL